MPNNDDSTPFTIGGETVARIYHDAGRVPYLLIVDNQGNTWRIYGYAQVSCACGSGGEWLPNRDGMLKVIKAWRKGRDAAKRARAELGEIGQNI